MPSPGKETFDLNSIDIQDRADIVTGIWKDTAESSLAGRLFGTGEEVKALEGSFPYMPSKTTMLRDTVHGDSRVALGGLPNHVRGKLAEKSYRFTHKYSLEGSVLKHQVFNLKNITSANILLDYILRMTMGQIALDIDIDLKELLLDTNENETVAATAAWSDNVNARPISDMEAIFDKAAGEYDTVVIGMDKVRALSALDTFKVMNQNYGGAGTSIEDARSPQRAVVDYLFREFGGVENIVIGNTWYDMNGATDVLAPARLFDGVVWAGAKEHIKMLKVSDLNEGDQTYDGKRQLYTAYENVYAKFIRLEKIMGTTLTGA